MINYKEALAHVSPNFDQDDPIRSVWILRKGGPVEDLASRMGASRMSNISRVSNSPSKISMKNINDPGHFDKSLMKIQAVSHSRDK